MVNRMDQLCYREDPVPEELWGAAAAAAFQCGYDQAEEELLDYQILRLRWVDPESMKTLYPGHVEPQGSLDPNDIVRVDWQTWAVPRQFKGDYEKAVIERVESIIVDTSTLRSETVFTYGLGPEYNWIDWEEHPSTGIELPDEVFESLSRLVTDEWCDDVREYADENPSYLDEVHPRLHAAVATVLAAEA